MNKNTKLALPKVGDYKSPLLIKELLINEWIDGGVLKWPELAEVTTIIDLREMGLQPPPLSYWMKSNNLISRRELRNLLENINCNSSKKQKMLSEYSLNQEALAYVLINSYTSEGLQERSKDEKSIRKYSKKSSQLNLVKRLRDLKLLCAELMEYDRWSRFYDEFFSIKRTEDTSYDNFLEYLQDYDENIGPIIDDILNRKKINLKGGKIDWADERLLVTNLAFAIKDIRNTTSITRCKNVISEITEVIYGVAKKPENIAKWLKQEISPFNNPCDKRTVRYETASSELNKELKIKIRNNINLKN